MAAKKKASPPNPDTFFGNAVPRVLSIMRDRCKEMGGTYTIDIEGVGAWTLDFPNATVVKGPDANATFTLHMTLDQFGSLTSASVELAKLVADKKVRLDGDASKIENVSLVLAFLAR
jgi:hypothetical protein